jgi:Zn-dependent alcohol dehydrogenase
VIENNESCSILRGRTLEKLVYFIPQEIPLEELLTHEVSLEDVDKAFELMKQLDCVKVLIKL